METERGVSVLIGTASADDALQERCIGVGSRVLTAPRKDQQGQWAVHSLQSAKRV